MANGTEAGMDMVVGRENSSQTRTILMAVGGEKADPDGYTSDFVLGVWIDGGWIVTGPTAPGMPFAHGIDGIQATGSIHSDATKGTDAGPMPAGNGVVGIGLNGLVGYVHSAPRDKRVELGSQAGILGIGDGAHNGVIGIGLNGLVGYVHSAPRDKRAERDSQAGILGIGDDGVAGISKTEGRSGVCGLNESIEGQGNGVFGRSDAPDGTGVWGEGQAKGVYGRSDAPGGTGVWGESQANGVYGRSDAPDGIGVWGEGKAKIGVYGKSEAPHGTGVWGEGQAKGVYGRSDPPDGTGVSGFSVHGNGIVGKTQGLNSSGVYGENTAVLEEPTPERGGKSHLIEPAPQTLGETRGRGIGVHGVSTNGVGVNGASYNNHGVVGEASRASSGVYGLNHYSGDSHGRDLDGLDLDIRQADRTSYGVTGHADDVQGIGVRGMSKHGYGATLQGGRAPLRLLPAETAGHPASGDVGELFVDSNGDLYFCKVKSTPGTPGTPGTKATWKKIA
jgi:hypothetical protein